MIITHIIFSFTTGGAETMLIDIANEQVIQTKVNIVIINNVYNEDLLNEIDKRVNVFFINRTESSKNPFPILKLNLLLLKLNSGVLHCHQHNVIQFLLPLFRKKSIQTVHDVGINIRFFKYYKKLFAISKSVKEDILRRSGLNVTLAYNGIRSKQVQIKDNYTLSNIFKTIIVSRLVHHKKGQHIAIEALHLLEKKGIKNIQIDLIGNGNSEQFLRELAEKFKLTGQVSFLGLKNRDYIYTHLKDYDLLIQPSLFEGFGLTVAESMAAKVPVLVSNVYGPMEIIQNGKYGFYFQSSNSEDLADQLLSIIEQYNSKHQQHMVEAAYEHALKNFDIENTAKYYLANY